MFFILPIICLLLRTSVTYAEQTQLVWENLAPGMQMANYSVPDPNSMISPEIILLKVNPELFHFDIAMANDLGKERTDVKALCKHTASVACINANFFDTQGKPLGLIVRNNHLVQKIQMGGNLLTGVFLLENSVPKIVHRSSFRWRKGIQLAVQSGPRLVSDGKPLKLSASSSASRRSGIAITNGGHIILFASRVRFPGITLHQIQRMLLDLGTPQLDDNPDLQVLEALNFDGGSSSQFYLGLPHQYLNRTQKDLLVTGGENVPVALIIKQQNK